jgi:hypothetical protein
MENTQPTPLEKILQGVQEERLAIYEQAKEIAGRKWQSNAQAQIEYPNLKDRPRYGIRVRNRNGCVNLEWVEIIFRKSRSPGVKWRVNYRHYPKTQIQHEGFRKSPAWERVLNKELLREIQQLEERLKRLTEISRKTHALIQLSEGNPFPAPIRKGVRQQNVFDPEDPLNVSF